MAPAMPIKRSTNTPYPEPRMIFPVAQPAINPTIIHHRKCIQDSPHDQNVLFDGVVCPPQLKIRVPHSHCDENGNFKHGLDATARAMFASLSDLTAAKSVWK